MIDDVGLFLFRGFRDFVCFVAGGY